MSSEIKRVHDHDVFFFVFGYYIFSARTKSGQSRKNKINATKLVDEYKIRCRTVLYYRVIFIHIFAFVLIIRFRFACCGGIQYWMTVYPFWMPVFPSACVTRKTQSTPLSTSDRNTLIFCHFCLVLFASLIIFFPLASWIGDRVRSRIRTRTRATLWYRAVCFSRAVKV